MSRQSTNAFARVFSGVTVLANVAATAWIILLMVLIVADVLGRNFLASPIAGVPEMVKFSIVGIVFLQITHTHVSGQMIRSDGLLAALIRRNPRLGHGLDAFAQATGAALTAALAWTVWPRLIKAYERGEFEGAVGHFVLPVWPFLAIIVAGSALLSLSYLIQCWQAVDRARTGAAPAEDR